jgi:hypothetical protein
LAAVLLKEPGCERVLGRLARLDVIYSSTLLEAEIRSVAAREKLDDADLEQVFSSVIWICPERPLSTEIRRVLKAGHLRGSDTWHLACALYLFEDPAGLPFLTLDIRQAKVASALGFSVIRI